MQKTFQSNANGFLNLSHSGPAGLNRQDTIGPDPPELVDRYGPSGSGRAGTRKVGYSPDKSML